MTHSKSGNTEALLHLIDTVHQLRAPGGCPWDRAQTHQTLRQYLIEEAYEVLDVIDQIHSPADLEKLQVREAFREELGDLLMQVLLHSAMTQEVGAFDIFDVARTLDEKLIRRHPHVFGEAKADSEESAFQRWEKEKAKEKASRPEASILEGVPKGLPALQRASRVIEKVTKVGFQWEDMNGPLGKVDEELAELKVEISALERHLKSENPKNGTYENQTDQLRKKVEGELGDLFFTLANVSYLLKINPEAALRSTLSKFESRFKHVERRLKEQGKLPEQSDLIEMDKYWDEAKRIEQVEVWGLTGGIGSGKSTVGQIFSEFGIPVIDADQISRNLMKGNGPVLEYLLQRFGTADRGQLREIVFNDPKAKKDLEDFLHPLIQAESKKEISKLSLSHRAVIYEASLLVETQRHADFSGLIVVEAPLESRIQRIVNRQRPTPDEVSSETGITKEMAEKIILSQISDDERVKHAQFVINNASTIEDLRTQVRRFVMQRGWQQG